MATSLVRTRNAILYASRRAHDAAKSSSVTQSSPAGEMESRIPVPRPFTHQLQRYPRRVQHILNEEFASEGYHDYSINRLYDYYKIGEYVRSLKTPAERIDFVNPYEREWYPSEKKWHRENMRPLHAPRRAWSLHPIPTYFDSEDFYMYITRTNQPLDENLKPIDGQDKRNLWEQRYHELNMPVKSFEKRVTESLICALDGKPEFDSESSDSFLKRFMDDAMCSLAHTNLLIDQRISHNPRCESFWICAGFENLYLVQDMLTGDVENKTQFIGKYTGDHRQKLGEFAFTMRDKFVAQIRQRTPLEGINLHGSSLEPLFTANPDFFDKFDPLSPLIYNLSRDDEPLWQCPGYEPDTEEPYPYGRLALKNVFGLNQRCQHWGITDEEELKETRLGCMRATAISSLFNWLNGQAHCAGYTQYTDDGTINLASQLVLSDGQEFFFSAGQLRTLAFNINFKRFAESNPSRKDLFIERTPNRVIFEGPYRLFDEYDPATNKFSYKDSESGEMKPGLNPIILDYFLGMLSMK